MFRATTLLQAPIVLVVFTALSWGQMPENDASLAARQRRVRFAIVLGRVAAFDKLAKSVWSRSRLPEQSDVHQSFSVRTDDGIPTVHYERHGGEESLVYHFSSEQGVSILRAPRGKSDVTPLRYVQPAHGEITVVVESAGDEETYATKSLWHLMIAQPEIYQRHLVPVLKHLRSDWQLVETADSIRETMVRASGSDPFPDPDRWPRLVAELGHRQFVARRSAERELLRSGQPALAFLRCLDQRQLDAEQRMRVRRIMTTLSVSSDDTPDRVAGWLVNDATVWVHFLSSHDAQHREVAARHLTRLLGREIEFDPWADGGVRQSQLERLRARVQRL